MVNKVSTVLDLDGKGFMSQIRQVRTNVQQAEGAMGKMKAGAKGLGDVMKANLAVSATAVGSALVKMGLDAVMAFQDLALEVGKFGDATGLAYDDASRLIEVAGDVGIEVGTLQGAVQRFNKEVGAGRVDLKQFGSDLVYAKDGSIDAYNSFINAATAIGAIEDPTKRAEAAQEAFGRSYGEIAELMEMDAEDLRTALGDVADSKVIDKGEVQRAREFRAALDNLKDTIEGIQLTVGENLVPKLQASFAVLEGIANVIGKLPDPVEKFLFGPSAEEMQAFNQWLGISEGLAYNVMPALDKTSKDLDGTMGDLGGTTYDAAQDFADLDKHANLAAGKLRDAENAARGVDDALEGLNGNLDQEEKWQAFGEAVWNLADGSGDAAEEMRDWKRAAADLVVGLEEMPDEQKTALLLQIDQGDKATVDATLFKWQQGIQVPVRFVGQGDVGFMKNARGTPPGGSPGGLTLVGEEGPELVMMPRGAHVTPAQETAQILGGTPGSPVVAGGGSTTVINVYTASDPNAVVAAIKKYERTNGKGWRS